MSGKEKDSELTRLESIPFHWASPNGVALISAILVVFSTALAVGGNAWVAFYNGERQRELEKLKSEEARILEMIKTGNPDKAAENLRFLLDAGLIVDSNVRKSLSSFLDTRKPGYGPSLPTLDGSPLKSNNPTQLHYPPMSQELLNLLSIHVPLRNKVSFARSYVRPTMYPYPIIGRGHIISNEERKSGIMNIGGKKVDYRNGITDAEAQQLLESDFITIYAQIDNLVNVKLTLNQRDAIADFIYDRGINFFKNSDVLNKINEGKFSEIPILIDKYKLRLFNGKGNQSNSRRDAEIELWKK